MSGSARKQVRQARPVHGGASIDAPAEAPIQYSDLWKRRVMCLFERDPAAGRALLRLAPRLPELEGLRDLLQLEGTTYALSPASADASGFDEWIAREGRLHLGFYVAIDAGQTVDRDRDAPALRRRLEAVGKADLLVVYPDHWLGDPWMY